MAYLNLNRRTILRLIWATGAVLASVAALGVASKTSKGGKPMGYTQPKPNKVILTDASTGDPHQVEARAAKPGTEAIDRRTIRQAIMTQLLTEVADEIFNSGTKVTRRENGKVTVTGTLMDAYKNGKLPLLRALIEDPEVAFNTRRNKVFVADDPQKPDPNLRLPFGSINLVVFRNAMALGDGDPNSRVDVEEVAKRVMIRAGRSSGYGKRLGGEYNDRGFAGCK